MKTAATGVIISPVNMNERKELGIRSGDTIRVHQKIQDKGKTRIQIFEGLVLARKHGDEPGATFTVRKVASGVGVEKIYPLYSPLIDKLEIVKRAKVRRALIDKLEIVKRAKVRRAKLYYIREKVAREIKRQMRRMSLVSFSTESETELAAKAVVEAKAAEAKATEEAELKAKAEQEAEEAKVAAEAEVAKEEEKVEAPEAEVAESVEEVKVEEPAEEKVEEEKK